MSSFCAVIDPSRGVADTPQATFAKCDAQTTACIAAGSRKRAVMNRYARRALRVV
jgi:hypothetical protein